MDRMSVQSDTQDADALHGQDLAFVSDECSDNEMLDADPDAQLSENTDCRHSIEPAVVVPGPRHPAHAGEEKPQKVSAVLDRSIANRLMLRLSNLDLKAKQRQTREQAFSQDYAQLNAHEQQCFDSRQTNMDDEGFQCPDERSHTLKQKTEGRSRGRTWN